MAKGVAAALCKGILSNHAAKSGAAGSGGNPCDKRTDGLASADMRNRLSLKPSKIPSWQLEKPSLRGEKDGFENIDLDQECP